MRSRTGGRGIRRLGVESRCNRSRRIVVVVGYRGSGRTVSGTDGFIEEVGIGASGVREG